MKRKTKGMKGEEEGEDYAGMKERAKGSIMRRIIGNIMVR
jgi:hypothetical protein